MKLQRSNFNGCEFIVTASRRKYFDMFGPLEIVKFKGTGGMWSKYPSGKDCNQAQVSWLQLLWLNHLRWADYWSGDEGGKT